MPNYDEWIEREAHAERREKEIDDTYRYEGFRSLAPEPVEVKVGWWRTAKGYLAEVVGRASHPRFEGFVWLGRLKMGTGWITYDWKEDGTLSGHASTCFDLSEYLGTEEPNGGNDNGKDR